MSRRDTLSRITDRIETFGRRGGHHLRRAAPSRAVLVAVTATAVAVPLAATTQPRSVELEAAPRPVSPTGQENAAHPSPVLPWLTVAQQGIAMPAGWQLGAPSDGTIPPTVLAAYRQAETALAASTPTCNLPWWLLAGIGHVESGHAAGGNVDAAGRTVGDIYGVVLDGTTPETAVVPDTDGGQIDGDPVYDRAVGPMQFLPSTWTLFATDGNDDGVADPHNVYDAAVTAGQYLCSYGGDLATPEAMRSAVLGYNPSTQYVQDVIAVGEAYRDGRTPPPLWTPPTVPAGTTPPTIVAAAPVGGAADTDTWAGDWNDWGGWDDPVWDDDRGPQAVAPRVVPRTQAARTTSPTPAPAPTRATTPTPRPTNPPSSPPASPTDTPSSPSPTGGPTTPAPDPTTTPAPGPTTTPAPDATPTSPYCEPFPEDWVPPLDWDPAQGWLPPEGWVPPEGWTPATWLPPEGWTPPEGWNQENWISPDGWARVESTATDTGTASPASPSQAPTTAPNQTVEGSPEADQSTDGCVSAPWAEEIENTDDVQGRATAADDEDEGVPEPAATTPATTQAPATER